MRSKPPVKWGGPEWVEDPETGCWVWSKSIAPNGYGVYIRGTAGKDMTKRAAHRWVYELLVGPVPEGLDLDHLCRNRACVRPAHLEPVTRAENLRRGRGTKLNHDIAQEIREAEGSHRAIAERFGTDHRTVGRIKRGEAWVAA